MLPVQITLREIPPSLGLEAVLHKKVKKLQLFYKRVMSCRIVVDIEQKNKHQGKLFNVRIDLRVPGKKEFVSTHKAHEDFYVAAREAFEAIYRQLEEHAKKRNGKVKLHNEVLHGNVTKLIPTEGCGYIEGEDGNEYFFSIDNVTFPKFTKLLPGDPVSFTGEIGNRGRQAQHITKERHFH